MDLFGTDGIRARAGEGPLAPEKVRRIGKSVGYLLKKKPGVFHTPVPRWFSDRHRPVTCNILGKDRVLIGRDTRPSGAAIEKDLIRGLSDFGVRTVVAGVIPTPGVSSLTRLWSCSLGIVISASHNPVHDNGIKLISPEGLKVPDGAEAAVEDLYDDPEFEPRIRHSKTRRVQDPKDAAVRAQEYVRWLVEKVEAKTSLKGLKIAVDGAHGAAAKFAPDLLRRAGAEVALLNDPPDGRLINKDCGALHPERLAAKTAEVGADLGVAFDGDGDRAILADEKGGLVDGDHMLAMHAIDLDRRGALPQRTVIGTVMSNYGLQKVLEEHGLRLERTKVGDRFVLEEMFRSGAQLGGEPSGHLLFLDTSPAGDGMLTTLRTAMLMKRRNAPLSELASVMRRFPQLLLNVPVLSRPPLEEVEPVRRALKEAENELGGKGRVVVRYSGTEPLCRVMVEGSDARQVRRIAESIAASVRRSIGDKNPQSAI